MTISQAIMMESKIQVDMVLKEKSFLFVDNNDYISRLTCRTIKTLIEQLEKKNAERAASAQSLQKAHEAPVKTHEERAQEFSRQIGKNKVGSLQAGRVLPEIAQLIS
jgi:hypothetical protein